MRKPEGEKGDLPGMGNRSDLERIGIKLLDTARTELYLAMRFMGPALMGLDLRMDLLARTVGTDAQFLRYNPVWLMQTYLEHPYILDRTYLHTVLHCLFRHMYGTDTHTDTELWNLCADIAVESVIDEMDYEVVRRTPSDFREEWYSLLSGRVGALTAERLYRYFEENPPDYVTLVKLSGEFLADDHVFWEMLEDEPDDGGGRNRDGAGLGTEQQWKKAAKRVASELRMSGKAGNLTGDLERLLSFDAGDRVLYRDLLKNFLIVREECRMDPDSFDYGFYNYGMELYGNMPLIEENESVESSRIRQLVVAIDTSASVSDGLVREFLSETAAMLFQKDSFFRKFEVHLVECDAAVRQDLVITDADTLDSYADGITLHGGGGTDFRPVFRYVEEQRKQGKLRDLSGLVYFTDGFGRYPDEAAPYVTAFVFPEEDPARTGEAPDWILKTYLR